MDEYLKNINIVRTYQSLQKNFLFIVDRIKEALQNDNDYGMVFLNSDDTKINLKVLNEPIEIVFSFIIDASNYVYGRLNFEYIIKEKDREHIMTLYFYNRGIVDDQDPPKYICDLENKHVGNRVLMLLLEKFLNLPRFKSDKNILQ